MSVFLTVASQEAKVQRFVIRLGLQQSTQISIGVQLERRGLSRVHGANQKRISSKKEDRPEAPAAKKLKTSAKKYFFLEF